MDKSWMSLVATTEDQLSRRYMDGVMELAARWKGKSFADIANSNPMSSIVSKLQASLTRSKSYAMITGPDVVLGVGPDTADLLNRALFGRPIITSNKDKQWFQLGPEEAFYLCHDLKCVGVISAEKDSLMSEIELWGHFKCNRKQFPELYKAYAHLRSKNWVVRSGIQYGVDFVAYRHHPALVHSEFAVIVLSGGSDNHRLRVWSDLQCSLRVSGSVAKTLLVLTVDTYGGEDSSPMCLEKFDVEERTISRWVAEQSREDHGLEG